MFTFSAMLTSIELPGHFENPENSTSRVQVHFFVCTNARADGSSLPSCGGRGSVAIHQAFTRELARRDWPPGVKATATSCLTPCQCGPNVVVYPHGVWYAGLTPEDVPAPDGLIT